jgi:hypothetical protein
VHTGRPAREAPSPQCTFIGGSLTCGHGDACPNRARHPQPVSGDVLTLPASITDPCSHGTPGGASRCALCRHGVAGYDDDIDIDRFANAGRPLTGAPA